MNSLHAHCMGILILSETFSYISLVKPEPPVTCEVGFRPFLVLGICPCFRQGFSCSPSSHRERERERERERDRWMKFEWRVGAFAT